MNYVRSFYECTKLMFKLTLIKIIDIFNLTIFLLFFKLKINVIYINFSCYIALKNNYFIVFKFGLIILKEH